MEIVKVGMAGTMESSDAIVTIEPNTDSGIQIYLQSSVEKQFGNQIRSVITETLRALDVDHGIVRVNDKGALDCVIRARVQTAVLRASDGGQFNWKEED
ncbi:citrate lyase acyl carrier protein [Anaerosolibacter sp.]|jgi:citrate lyase subunit gamma (acyl carrier protein)|uniref:citrate lyase acyl carrier protein n=1 Tax=Anaerosolibacter sp. TaxID=1872527 RepID=UPI00262C24F6|nr:citrate lyase acyl carrier protein [Anaerosolibacter sp.]MDF2545407.1 citD2 [Anaerosolibacter sp.]